MKLTSALFFGSLIILMSVLLCTSCKESIPGCTDATAVNFDMDANENDGSCQFLADILVGEWEVTSEKVNGVETTFAIRFEFSANGSFVLTHFSLAPGEFTSDGTWSLDNTLLTINWSSSLIFCGETSIQFFVEMMGMDDLKLSMICPDGDSYVYELERS